MKYFQFCCKNLVNKCKIYTKAKLLVSSLRIIYDDYIYKYMQNINLDFQHFI